MSSHSAATSTLSALRYNVSKESLMPKSPPLIQASHLSFQYAHEQVLTDVSFSIYPGEFVGIIGPNGSGKTTLLKLMLGLLPAPPDTLKVFGAPMRAGSHADKLSYIPQKVTQMETRFPITVREVVELGMIARHHLGQPFSGADHQAVEKALAAVDLSAHQGRQLAELSGGQQQRVFIAKALASQPQLLILDEPTVGIDPSAQAVFYTLLANLHRKQKLTIVLVSHDIDVVAKEVSTVLCLNRTLVYHGSSQGFLNGSKFAQLYGQHHKLVHHNH